MALITEFEPRDMDRSSLHDPISARYAVFERDGRTLLQIDTYGRATREHPDKVSQSIQLDREGATALLNIIRNAFHLD